MAFQDEPVRKSNSQVGPIITAIITAICGIIIVYVQFVVPQKLAIQTTQTAESRLISPIVTEPVSAFLQATIPVLPSTPTPTSTQAPFEVFSTDKLVGLNTYNSVGSTMALKVVPSLSDNGLEISYNLQEGGWVGVFRIIDSKILSGTNGIKLYYLSSGAPNTLELKLEYVQGTVFSVLCPGLTADGGWQSLEIPYTDFTCWVGTPGCPTSLALSLDLEKIVKIGFAISHKPDFNDVSGSGKIVIDGVQGIQP